MLMMTCVTPANNLITERLLHYSHLNIRRCGRLKALFVAFIGVFLKIILRILVSLVSIMFTVILASVDDACASGLARCFIVLIVIEVLLIIF